MSDTFELLRRDHREIADLFERYDESPDDEVAHRIFDLLAAHAAVEDAAFYPEVRRVVDGGDDLADRADAEHAAVRELVTRALGWPPDELKSLVHELKRDVERHVAFEEQELFPVLESSGGAGDGLASALQSARDGLAPAPGAQGRRERSL